MGAGFLTQPPDITYNVTAAFVSLPACTRLIEKAAVTSELPLEFPLMVTFSPFLEGEGDDNEHTPGQKR